MVISYIKKNGTVTVYDNKAHMRKSYAKLKDLYNVRILCQVCNKEYTKPNKTHHINTKIHKLLEIQSIEIVTGKQKIIDWPSVNQISSPQSSPQVFHHFHPR